MVEEAEEEEEEERGDGCEVYMHPLCTRYTSSERG